MGYKAPLIYKYIQIFTGCQLVPEEQMPYV